MKVDTSDHLQFEHIFSLIAGKVAVVRIPEYYNTELCETITKLMLNSKLYNHYANAPEIFRVGQAFFESLSSEAHAKAYLAHAVEWVQQMRDSCAPYLTPIDKLRLNLDELWPGGTVLATIRGKKMFVGLARIFNMGSHAEPHQDFLSWDAPGVEEAISIQEQVAANIYLQMPTLGGELLIWPKSLNFDEYQSLRIPESYGVSTDLFDCKPTVITPRVGELVLFNSRLVHAVKGSIDGNRIAWSCFVGYQGASHPLVVWS